MSKQLHDYSPQLNTKLPNLPAGKFCQKLRTEIPPLGQIINNALLAFIFLNAV